MQVYEATPSGGHVTAYLAGPSGPVDGSVATAVSTAFESNAKRPLCVTLHISPAVNHAVTLTGTVTVEAARLASAQAALTSALTAYTASLDLGSTVILSKLVQLIMEVQGVLDVSLATPSANVVLGTGEMATFVNSLSWVTA